MANFNIIKFLIFDDILFRCSENSQFFRIIIAFQNIERNMKDLYKIIGITFRIFVSISASTAERPFLKRMKNYDQLRYKKD